MSATSEGLEQSIPIHLHIFIYRYTHIDMHVDRHRHRHKHSYRVDRRLLSNVLHDLHLLPKRSLWIQQLGFLSRSFLGDRLSIPPADPTRSSSSEIAWLELDLSMLLLGPASANAILFNVQTRYFYPCLLQIVLPDPTAPVRCYTAISGYFRISGTWSEIICKWITVNL